MSFWRNRRVLLTGHTGFKGTWMTLWLRALGAEVTGIALPPPTNPNFWSLTQSDVRSFVGDIREPVFVRRAVAAANPEIVIHMAAQATVRRSYADPVETFGTNVMGTAHLLDACRDLSHLLCCLVVTSDKVYANDNTRRPFVEGDRLGGDDPYSSSKACTEFLTQSFRNSFFRGGARIVTARAGNVIGGGDWAPDRLVPDCIRALTLGEKVKLRAPDSVRPWQHVLEPLSGYLSLVQVAIEEPLGVPLAVNFGPDPSSFRAAKHVVAALGKHFEGKLAWIPMTGEQPPEATALTLTSELAHTELGWQSRLDVETAIAWTAEWYKNYFNGRNVEEMAIRQIREYENLTG
jgi:CDP-glucose 4,6-dehydratase